MRVLAVDIGGTKLAAMLGDEVAHVATGADPWAALTGLLDPLVVEGIDAIGVGSGGPMEWPAGVLRPLNIPDWVGGFPLRAALTERYGVPVRLHNDAVCVAVGEHSSGGWGTDDLLGMVVSTGVGGGIISGGRVVDGASGNAGHVGHVVVEPDGPDCTCGGRGCLEAVARGPAVVARAAARGSAATDGRSLVALAEAGDRVAVEELARAGRAIGVGVASAVALLDVRVVVIGGGLSQAGPLLWEPLREAFAAHARLDFLAGCRVEPTALGQRAGLVGAAALWEAGDRYWSAD